MTEPSQAQIYRGTPSNLRRLARCLREGSLVAVPTETVYGLGANALDAEACRKIFRAKRRPLTDPLIVHLHSLAQLPLVCRPSASAMRLARAFWPGPLTMVLPKTSAIPGTVTAGKRSVAVRMPAHRVLHRLLELADVPVAAPSANPFGYVSPTTAQHVLHGLGDRIQFILDGGPTRIGVESTIIDLRRESHPRLLRPGAVTLAQLEKVLGRRVTVGEKKRARRAKPVAQVAPGLLARHYSPHTPVVLHRKLNQPTPRDEALVFFDAPRGLRGRNVFSLGGNATVAARRLFSLLRRLDRRGFKRIHVELAPGKGLADAINDRLRRAAAP